jgi:hypothetical protein
MRDGVYHVARRAIGHVHDLDIAQMWQPRAGPDDLVIGMRAHDCDAWHIVGDGAARTQRFQGHSGARITPPR